MATRRIHKIENPFIYQGYESPSYFCDREEETRAMLSHFKNGRNVTLISPRRIGKTGLIKNAFYHIEHERKKAICLYVDIFSTKCLQDFVEMLGSAVMSGFANKEKSFLEKAASLIGALRPVVSLDPFTGAPKVTVAVAPGQSQMTIKSIFDYLQHTPREVYVAIDEFQQIAEYPESGTEALLRSYVQFTQNVHFVFAGSKQHLMAEMFGSPSRPFFQSTEMMNLQPLDEPTYYDFANGFFQKRNGSIDEKVFSEIYHKFDGHTWYIQSILNRLYERYKVVDDMAAVNHEIMQIVASKSAQYESLAQFLTAKQFALLKAVASDGIVAQPTSANFIQRHHLASASAVQTSMKALLKHELLYRGSQGYMVYDRFMGIWLKSTFG